ncbi:ADP-ribosylation factor 1 [Galdieria sulphuraria]|uniref:ADP-ribosylation factor isoform 1 n=1 Tax=Galdieria sulphuraria TaxID=130081 RepID=M2W7Y2_GALSU|nr:ADP-ribosylation factor isoform 1 [Galdieria sulphuraria]EME31946.1 ADP-ribosylation factor isoform 1 [Galdieria sulphuraria]GJD08028.1 ADP-ribosylation factor 1 [Galdieria sulphuraria]|eukprot:XP_005708466.1 ADP-ribosylation factor isoform 1 [Galdieria sulphuraria]
MGNIFSRLFQRLFGNKEVRVLMVGLDNAGKTTLLYRIKEGSMIKTVPTIGFNMEQIEVNNLKMQVWDLGGQTSIRPYWRSYYQKQEALIFVVDSNDRERFSTAKTELLSILQEEELKNTVIAVFANKQDLPEAASAAEVSLALGLDSIKDRTWTIISTSAAKGDGIAEGFEWIASQLKH